MAGPDVGELESVLDEDGASKLFSDKESGTNTIKLFYAADINANFFLHDLMLLMSLYLNNSGQVLIHLDGANIKVQTNELPKIMHHNLTAKIMLQSDISK